MMSRIPIRIDLQINDSNRNGLKANINHPPQAIHCQTTIEIITVRINKAKQNPIRSHSGSPGAHATNSSHLRIYVTEILKRVHSLPLKAPDPTSPVMNISGVNEQTVNEQHTHTDTR